MEINPLVIIASLKQYVKNNPITFYCKSERANLKDFKILAPTIVSGKEYNINAFKSLVGFAHDVSVKEPTTEEVIWKTPSLDISTNVEI